MKTKKAKARTATGGSKKGKSRSVFDPRIAELRFSLKEMKDKLRIDTSALGEEVEQQAEIYGEVSDAAARVKSVVDAEENKLSLLYSKVDERLRVQAENEGETITEANIKAKIPRDEGYQSQVVLVHQVKELQRQLEALERSFRMRSYMLRDLVEMQLTSVYTPRSARGARHRYEESQAEDIVSQMGAPSRTKDRKLSRARSRRKSLAKG